MRLFNLFALLELLLLEISPLKSPPNLYAAPDDASYKTMFW
jgi:hypothetical protein